LIESCATNTGWLRISASIAAHTHTTAASTILPAENLGVRETAVICQIGAVDRG
jgi:hypothetical protein